MLNGRKYVIDNFIWEVLNKILFFFNFRIHDFMRRQKYQFNTTDYDNLKKRLLISHDDINRY